MHLDSAPFACLSKISVPRSRRQITHTVTECPVPIKYCEESAKTLSSQAASDKATRSFYFCSLAIFTGSRDGTGQNTAWGPAWLQMCLWETNGFRCPVFVLTATKQQQHVPTLLASVVTCWLRWRTKYSMVCHGKSWNLNSYSKSPGYEKRRNNISQWSNTVAESINSLLQTTVPKKTWEMLGEQSHLEESLAPDHSASSYPRQWLRKLQMI